MIRSFVRKMSATANSSKLYELRVYSLKPGNIKKAMEHAEVALPVRFKHSPALGYFFSEIGGLGEAIHIWEYDSYGHRAAVRKTLAADPDWGKQAAPMIAQFERQDNLTMRLFPWSSVKTDVTPGGVFFLYRFTFSSNLTSNAVSDKLQRFIRDADLDALGVWKEELGQNSLKNAYAVFHSQDFDSAKNPALASPEAWAKLNECTSQVHGRLLTAASWSDPWK